MSTLLAHDGNWATPAWFLRPLIDRIGCELNHRMYELKSLMHHKIASFAEQRDLFEDDH